MAEKRSNVFFELFKILIIALILAFIVRKFLYSPIIVDGPSMQPTLYNGDQMIVNKFMYRFTEPERFDIVIFHAFEQKDYIKRIIGLPGEHVKVEKNQLYIDGELIQEPFLLDEDGESLMYTHNFTLEQLPGGHERIPEGYVLVLGDNRMNSTDSRSFGLVDINEIVGKTNIIYWPFNRIQITKDKG